MNFDFFADKTIVWIRFIVVPRQVGLVTEFNDINLVAFDIEYNYQNLIGFAQWSEDRITWNNF